MLDLHANDCEEGTKDSRRRSCKVLIGRTSTLVRETVDRQETASMEVSDEIQE